jgi:zinc transport system ATP-binding protein
VTLGRTSVLRALSFSVFAGDTLAIIGPSGSGKTVLLKALLGAIPSEGVIRWAPGTTIGYVPQKLDIERNLPITGIDLLRAKASLAKRAAEEVARVVDLVHLTSHVAGKPVGTLSGGQFQRLLIAFALLGEPSVLLCDEPTAGVDEPGEESLYAMIRRVQESRKLTLLLVSHELTLVYRYATQVLCLGRSRSWFGPPLEILTPERLQEVYGSPMKFHLHDDRLG